MSGLWQGNTFYAVRQRTVYKGEDSRVIDLGCFKLRHRILLAPECSLQFPGFSGLYSYFQCTKDEEHFRIQHLTLNTLPGSWVVLILITKSSIHMNTVTCDFNYKEPIHMNTVTCNFN